MHRTKDVSLNITNIVKTFQEYGFTGYARPNHGRLFWMKNVDQDMFKR
ncbi:mannonate dehydratase [Lederbergia wuyishanensis]|nr:mannonate dehydratase [Lederbergia wuyishanensis]